MEEGEIFLFVCKVQKVRTHDEARACDRVSSDVTVAKVVCPRHNTGCKGLS